METLFQEGCWDDTIKKSKEEEEDREILTKNKNKTKKKQNEATAKLRLITTTSPADETQLIYYETNNYEKRKTEI